MYLIIDVGNTRVKTAVFDKGTIIYHTIFAKTRIISEVKKVVLTYEVKYAIISAVATLSKSKLEKLDSFLDLLVLNHQTKVPFKNLYKTPNTLGVDRIALAAAAMQKYPNKNVLVIDAGTCITFDFINKQAEYLGGAISPGIRLRYRALHTFTAKLPLLETTSLKNYIGNDTQSSIHSGVINGVFNEINGVINQYKNEFEDLTVVLTGGDANFLAEQFKNGIFANPNFVLEGLYTILIHNTSND